MDKLLEVKKTYKELKKLENKLKDELELMDSLKNSIKSNIREIVYSCQNPDDLIKVINEYNLDCLPRMAKKAYANTFSDVKKTNAPHWEDVLYMCVENLYMKLEEDEKKV